MNVRLLVSTLFVGFCGSLSAADVDFYGRAHVSLDHLDNDIDSGWNIASNSSRFGLKMSHQLEPGLTVVAQIETLVRIDEGSGNLASRDTFVGLKSNFGLLRLGYFDTPMKKVRSSTDLFSDKVGDARNIVGGGGVALDKRFRNGIHYQSPAYQNLTFDLHYSTNDATGSTTNNENDAISSAVSYRIEGLLLMLAYERQNQLTAPAQTGVRLGASYQLSPLWRVTGFYQHSENFANGDRRAYGAGVRYKLGSYDISAQIYAADSADQIDSGANMLALGIDRKFANNFSLYSALVFTDNQSNATFNVAAGGHGESLTITPGADPAALSFGAIYNF